MKIIAIVALREGGDDALATYVETVSPLIEKAGGKLIDRFKVAEVLEGNTSAQFITSVRYPDRLAVAQVFDSEEYHKLRSVREQAFSRYDVYVVEE